MTPQSSQLRPNPSAYGDFDLLNHLNDGYIRAVEEGDVGWFDEHLAPDFLNSNPDCSLIDKQGFLKQVAQRPFAEVRCSDVRIRQFGNIALIHAASSFVRRADGTTGKGRYTDIWERREYRWLCIAAQVTRA